MSSKRSDLHRRFREEFAFDLTPDVNEGERSSMHNRTRAGAEKPGRGREEKAAPDDVEWGPSVRGHDFRVN